MNDKLTELLEDIRALERDVRDELHNKEKEFYYKVHERKVQFEDAIKTKHKQQAKNLVSYILGIRLSVLLSAPFIYICFIPAVFLDLSISIYQRVCFPIYKIPRVKRADYIIFDRHHLAYLNAIEKVNCAYCSYVNGLIGYAQEIAGRTEQYWCPIKHATKANTTHKRYQHFFDYGDADRYNKELSDIRKAFDDVKQDPPT